MEQATSSNRYLFSVPFWIRIHATGSFLFQKEQFWHSSKYHLLCFTEKLYRFRLSKCQEKKEKKKNWVTYFFNSFENESQIVF